MFREVSLRLHTGVVADILSQRKSIKLSREIVCYPTYPGQPGYFLVETLLLHDLPESGHHHGTPTASNTSRVIVILKSNRYGSNILF